MLRQLVRSDDHTVETGPVTNLVAAPNVVTNNPDAVAGGFIVSTTFNMMPGGSTIAFILDADGDIVWWFNSSLSDTTRARMTYDGKHMAMIPSNNQGNLGAIQVVTMDGLEPGTFNKPGATHDLVGAPGGRLAYIDISGEWQPGMSQVCGKIVELDENGIEDLIYDTAEVLVDECHANAIRYSEAEDVYTISDLLHNAILAVGRDGTLKWVFGGTDSDFTGGSWSDQHGHHLLENSIVLYSNSTNAAIEYELDFSDMTATEIWRYSSGYNTMTLGDVQRLSNGNTLVTYSNDGVLHEVDADENLVRSLTFSQAAPGYAVWRSSLYGPADDITM